MAAMQGAHHVLQKLNCSSC